MECGDLREKIKEPVVLLEGNSGFSPMVDESIESLRAVDPCVSEPTEERLGDSKRRLSKLARDIEPYRGFVPVLEENLDALAPWLEART